MPRCKEVCLELSGVRSDSAGLWVEQLKMESDILKCGCEKNKVE